MDFSPIFLEGNIYLRDAASMHQLTFLITPLQGIWKGVTVK